MTSPFANVASTYREQGLAVMPCGPGTKFPGMFNAADGWRTAFDWQKYCERLPSGFEMDIWERWPNAGVCLALGRSSCLSIKDKGLQLIAVDIDTDAPDEVAAIRAVLPGSPVRKRGAKGETEFYLASVDVPNRPYNDAAKRRLLDLLGHGRQTVLPPTIHPDTGAAYRWTTLDTLESFDVADLPRLPDDIADRLSVALAPFGHVDAPKLASGNADPDAEASTHRQLNDAALANLAAWVPALGLYRCRQVGGKYKAVASWRPSTSGRPLSSRATNLAISPEGIRDKGEEKGYTPLDLVMSACGADLDSAFRWLQERVAPQPTITLTARVVDAEPPAHSVIDEPPARVGNLAGLRLATFLGEPVQPGASKSLDEGEDAAPIVGNLALKIQSEPDERENADAYDLLAIEDWAMAAGKPDLAMAIRRDRLGMTSPGSISPPPIDLWQRHSAPSLPNACLPSVIQNFASAQSVAMGADAAGLAMSALAAAAAAIGDEIEVQVKANDPAWRESARLWVGLVGMPSTKKTPIMSAAMRPLRAIDRAMAEQNAATLGEWQRLDKKVRETTPMPTQPRRVVEDATIEALQEVLKDSPHGVISMQDELSGWFGAMDKYSPGKGAAADRAFWLKSFNGGSYSINRIARGAAFIPNLSIGLLGGIQPEPLRKLAGDSVDDGLIQRFLPVVLRPATIGQDAPAGGEVEAYNSTIHRLIAMRAPRAGNLGPAHPLRFDTEAQAKRAAMEAEHVELVQALETVSPKLAAHIGKHDGIFARLCLVWHCVDHADDACLPDTITGDVAERVARFMREFVRPSAIAFYAGMLGMSAGHEDLMALASVIVSDCLDEVTAREVQRSTRALRHVTADEARRLCEKLEAFGWLTSIDPRQKSASPRWKVVPAVHTLFAERGRIEADRRAAARKALAEALAG